MTLGLVPCRRYASAQREAIVFCWARKKKTDRITGSADALLRAFGRARLGFEREVERNQKRAYRTAVVIVHELGNPQRAPDKKVLIGLGRIEEQEAVDDFLGGNRPAGQFLFGEVPRRPWPRSYKAPVRWL